ncbi:MAG: hypothetical protein O2960_22155 [Verrucomicrobia bacterium]|nr:hypothetical protein [Verrucomicrobiota bacterium]
MKPYPNRFVAALTAACTVFFVFTSASGAAPSQWWKGNLHTHTLWSDGDDYPEMVTAWYKSNGYDFLALSDHNVLSAGQRWSDIAKNKGGDAAFRKYLDRFGESWVEQKHEEGKHLVRLKPLGEYRHLFEEPNRFLMIESEEITDAYQDAPVHINATNLRHFIKPQGGGSVLEVMQNNVNAVLRQRRETGQPMVAHLNHPNFVWGVTAEELMRVQGERFFEVYNGHPAVHNEGDATHAGTDRMWDIILTWRLAILNMEPIFGLGVDDSHNYHTQSSDLSNSGRGWIMVRAAHLTPEHIIKAMEAGDFYATSGVRLKDFKRELNRLTIEIDPEDGVSYKTLFIGTRKGFNQTSEPILGNDGKPLRVTHRYSDEIGMVLAEQTGLSASYPMRGDEIYVRAKIVSSKLKQNPYLKGEYETAWVQPFIPNE